MKFVLALFLGSALALTEEPLEDDLLIEADPEV